ncbi:sensor histidine kinase [Mangrovihabitans endophyticus]|uniref:histidine kinase n=1 Tax=Mangrovihabitans endophyticus TaxID=1751298 RepID=A0A8J3FLW2_9ACTN|nr:sensor histidine kinase [Mangrovihabitans endophyticus]GGK72076.1 two-component sensor histidine kinase [Mangrovihabitans endophyticus]
MRESGRSHPRRRGRHSDWPVGAVVVAALCHVFGARAEAADGVLLRPLDALTYAVLLLGPAALFWRRRAPIGALVVALAGGLGLAAVAPPVWNFAVAPAIAVFSAVKAGRGRAAVPVAMMGYLAWVAVYGVFAGALGVPGAARLDTRTALIAAGGLALVLFLGGAAKAQSEHVAEMIKVRAEREQAREEQERRQASEERLRMARELHDVLGHHLSLINVQAGVGLHLMDNRPEQAREALTAIKTASSEALREVRAVLGVLRPEEEAAPRQPALGLDRIEELTAGAGLPVTVTVAGTRRALPAEVDRAAYRIVQEALTNVRKHAAAGATAQVTAAYEPGELRLTVRNDGPAPSRLPSMTTLLGGARGEDAATGGSGIAGMRARARSLGGSLTAGPLAGGGFEVVAVLPAGAAEEGDA